MGHHLSKFSSAFQHGVEHESLRNHILKHFACTVTFFGFLLLLSWYYGRSDLDRRWDPIEAANEERDAAIEQRDDAQRTWQETESKYEKTLATNLALRSKIEQDSKGIPWLKQRLSELVEESNTQHGAIEDLEAIKRKYDKLSKQVNDYGLSAERPEHHQKRAEGFRRSLDASNNSLQTSQSYAKGLEERLQKQLEKSNTEINWLRTRLRRNARSTGYWARYRQHADDPGFKPAWGVRCADTQRDLGQHKAMVEELRNDISGKDVEISRLESANPENIRLLTIANTNLNELRRKNAEYKEQSETQTAKIGEWEAAGRVFDARVEAKDQMIAELEEKANEQSKTHTTKLGEWEAAGRDLNARVEAKDHKIAELESQIRSYDDAIYKKDKDYKELYDHYLGEKQVAVDKYNGDAQTVNTMQKGYADREHELQRQWSEHSRSHVNCGGQITSLTKHIHVLQGQLADLRTKLQQAKNQTNPLQEMQLKEREVAVKAKEDALKKSTDLMDNDQQVSNSGGLEMEDLERRLAAANQEINDVKTRNRVVSGQLNKEKKERSEEKARHELLLKQEQQTAKTKCDVLRISLEKEHPLKRVVSKLQDELIKLREEAEKRK